MLTGTVNDSQPWLAVDLLAVGGQYLSPDKSPPPKGEG